VQFCKEGQRKWKGRVLPAKGLKRRHCTRARRADAHSAGDGECRKKTNKNKQKQTKTNKNKTTLPTNQLHRTDRTAQQCHHAM